MINKCACGCNPQQGKLNINSNLNKDFNKVIKSPNQSDLNKQLLLQQLNKKPGSISGETTGIASLPNDLVLSQLKELNTEVDAMSNDIDGLQNSISELNTELDNLSDDLFEEIEKKTNVSANPKVSSDSERLTSIEISGSKYKLDFPLHSEVVHKTGSEDISGQKVFKDGLTTYKTNIQNGVLISKDTISLTLPSKEGTLILEADVENTYVKQTSTLGEIELEELLSFNIEGLTLKEVK